MNQVSPKFIFNKRVFRNFEFPNFTVYFTVGYSKCCFNLKLVYLFVEELNIDVASQVTDLFIGCHCML